MQRVISIWKALWIGFALLASGAASYAQVPATVTIVSDDSWAVEGTDDHNMSTQGASQVVCLNAMNPSNCPVQDSPAPTIFGWALPGWAIDYASLPNQARWMWASGISGGSARAASQMFKFTKDFYLCSDPGDGTVSLAADNFAEVRVNGNLLTFVDSNGSSDTNSTSPERLVTAQVPRSFLKSGVSPNTIVVTARNGTDTSSCFPNTCPDLYQYNPAGVMLAASFPYTDPQCVGRRGQKYSTGAKIHVRSCGSGQQGSVLEICACGLWVESNACSAEPPPPHCTKLDGTMARIGDSEDAPACAGNQTRVPSSRRCQSNGSWDTAFGECTARCIGQSNVSYSVGQDETISCPADLIGSASQRCQADGRWSIADYSACRRLAIGRGEVCGNHADGEMLDGKATSCPTGTECNKRKLTNGHKPPWWCNIPIVNIFGGDTCRSSPPLYSTAWFCDPP